MRHLFILPYFTLLSCFLSSLTHTTQTDDLQLIHQHSRFHLARLPVFKLYDNSPITFKNRKAYQSVIDRWQNKLHKLAEKLFDQLYEEFGVSAEETYAELNNLMFVARYHKLQEPDEKASQTFIEEDDADPEVINFIRSMLQRYTTKTNIKIILTDAISTNTATYGSDLHQHYLFCNADLYTKENVKNFYTSMNNDHKFFYLENLPNNSIRWICMPNLLLLGLTEAAAHIQHQSHLLTFLIAHCSCNGKKASSQLVYLCIKFHKFLSLLEAVFQSTNPLEAAMFLKKSPHRSDAEKKIWKKILKDIAESYSANSFELFKFYCDQIKQKSE